MELNPKCHLINPMVKHIDLFHDFSYDTSESQNVKSFTVNQRPDIVLRITKNDLKEKYVLTYLYDAKYRLASDQKEGSPDLPTEDSINQMHRYRDAIYYVNKEKVKPEKEVIGAYILFPGSGEIETIKNLDYYKSIESVNIGAFPLRPNDYTNRSPIRRPFKDNYRIRYRICSKRCFTSKGEFLRVSESICTNWVCAFRESYVVF